MEMKKLKIFRDVKLIKRALSFMLAVMMVMPSIMYSVFAGMADVKAAEAVPVAEGEAITDCFPDAEFASYVYRTVLEKDSGSYSSYDLTSDDVKKIKEEATELKLNGASDLTGIENFTKLTLLWCRNKYGSSLSSVDISKNTELTCLDIGYNKSLGSIDTSNNPKLKELRCDMTQISDVDVTNNPDLTYLDVSNTGISELDLSNNPALKELRCYYNELITDLDVTNNPALTYLDVGNTGIINIDLTESPQLSEFRCHNSNMGTLNVTKNTALTYLDVSNTKITRLNLENNPALKELRCDMTDISTLNISNNPNLTYLDISHTKIASLDVSHLSNLTNLRAAGAKLRSLNLEGKTFEYDSYTPYHDVTVLKIDNQTPDFEYEKTEDGQFKILNMPIDGNMTNLIINDSRYEGSLTSDIIIDTVPQNISYNYNTQGTFHDVAKDTSHTVTVYVTSDKIYENVNIANEEKGVSAAGPMDEGALLKVEDVSQNGSSYNALLESMGDNKEVLSCYDVFITNGTYTKGVEMTLTFSVDPQYNGRAVIVKHMLSDGTIETHNAVVSDGKVQITVTELSPFMIALAKETQNPNPGEENPGEENPGNENQGGQNQGSGAQDDNSNQVKDNEYDYDEDIVSYGSEYQTGDNANILGLMLIFIISGSALIIASCIVYRNKKLYKK